MEEHSSRRKTENDKSRGKHRSPKKDKKSATAKKDMQKKRISLYMHPSGAIDMASSEENLSVNTEKSQSLSDGDEKRLDGDDDNEK